MWRGAKDKCRRNLHQHCGGSGHVSRKYPILFLFAHLALGLLDRAKDRVARCRSMSPHSAGPQMKQIFRAMLCTLCVAVTPSAYAGIVELSLGAWSDNTVTLVNGRDWDARPLTLPVLGTHSVDIGTSPYAQPVDASAQAFTSVTGLEFDFGDSYLLQILVTNTAYASVGPSAAEGTSAYAWAGVGFMALGFDLIAPVLYVGAHDLRLFGDSNIYSSGSILQPGRYGTDLIRDFNRAFVSVSSPGQSAFDFATTTHAYRFQAVPVPAPAVLPLILSGLFGIALARRRRR
jgi:hypothetical protein